MCREDERSAVDKQSMNDLVPHVCDSCTARAVKSDYSIHVVLRIRTHFSGSISVRLKDVKGWDTSFYRARIFVSGLKLYFQGTSKILTFDCK